MFSLSMASRTCSFLPIPLSISQVCCDKHLNSSLSLPWSPFYGNKLLIRHLNPSNVVPKCHRSSASAISCSLPTKKFSPEKVPKWSSRAIRSFGLGRLEARALKYHNTGTESLLMGILVEGTSPAAKFLRANGITFFKVQEEAVNLLGKSNLHFFSPEVPPLTEQAQIALDWAVEEKLKSGDSGEITTTYVLLGIWSVTDSAGHKILAKLGFNNEKAKELAKTMNEEIPLNFRKQVKRISEMHLAS